MLKYKKDKQQEGSNGNDKANGSNDVKGLFLSRLKCEHHDLCPWNGNACPKEFLQLPPMAGDDSRKGKAYFV